MDHQGFQSVVVFDLVVVFVDGTILLSDSPFDEFIRTCSARAVRERDRVDNLDILKVSNLSKGASLYYGTLLVYVFAKLLNLILHRGLKLSQLSSLHSKSWLKQHTIILVGDVIIIKIRCNVQICLDTHGANLSLEVYD